MNLKVTEGRIQGAGISLVAEFPVLEARVIGPSVVVVYDYMAFDSGAPARNLYCYGRDGALIWRAEDIGAGATDADTGILSDQPLWVGNFAGWTCRIDESTGKVLDRRFTK